MPSRSSGLLLHLTSLPGALGLGDLGPASHRFAGFLARSGQRLWQMLPVVPTGPGHSPYSSPSTFAGSPLLISPEGLLEDGLLEAADLAEAPPFPAGRVDFDLAIPFRQGLLRRAAARFEAGAAPHLAQPFEAFCHRHASWLDDHALFMALKEAHGGAAWTAWPEPLRRRERAALERARREEAEAVERHRLWQFLFERQWTALRAACAAHGVRLVGDLPVYVALESADVWAHPELFQLDERGRPTAVAGVPPDYFSETGQRWGNPLYRWDRMREGGFQWWTARLARTLEMVDLVRLDHFRGFEAYWAIPAEEETAEKGTWVEGPGRALFEALEARLGRPLPVIAENLGVITPGVTGLMERSGLPGMAVLLFGFEGEAGSEHLPHNFATRLVAYTGTHDNDTVLGWWRSAPAEARARARRYLGFEAEAEAPWAFIRAVMTSVAETAVVPVQDLLGLGAEARMNTPGEERGNWAWRLEEGALTNELAERLRALTDVSGRRPIPETGSPEDEG